MNRPHLPIAVGYSIPELDECEGFLDNRAARRWLVLNQNRSSHATRSHGAEIQRWRLFLTAKMGMHHDLLYRADEGMLAEYEQILLGAGGVAGSLLIDKRILSLCGFHSQPFLRKRSRKTVRQSLVILKSFYDHLSGEGREKASLSGSGIWETVLIQERAGTVDPDACRNAIAAMIDAANLGAAEGESPQRYWRALWIVRLTTRLKLQRSEISNLRMGDFSRSGTGAWKVSVTRKYGKKRTLVLSEDFMEDFLDYRKSLGLGSPPTTGEALKAIAPIRSGESPSRSDKVDLGVEISWLADRTLEYLGRAGPVDPAVGAFLENHPTIWFRNHSLSQKILSGWDDEFE